jgi:hypothetical protein
MALPFSPHFATGLMNVGQPRRCTIKGALDVRRKLLR